VKIGRLFTKETAMTDYRQLLALSNEQLGRVDPLLMNLLVAKSIPALTDLDIPRYQHQRDLWFEEVQQRLPAAEEVFWQTPGDWKNEVNFFRLGVVCGYLENEVGIAYNEDQRENRSILYADPSDL